MCCRRIPAPARLRALLLCLLVPAALAPHAPAHAQNPDFYQPRDIRVDQRLEQPLPLDAPFTDETGRSATLGTWFGKKPVLLNMIFYRCAGVCTLELDGLVKAFGKMDLRPGRDFEVVTVSIDPGEGPELARDKKASYLALLQQPAAAPGWHFLTGPQDSITRLAAAVGFHYRHNEKDNTFAHPAALMVCTPEGKLSRYFFGSTYSPRDLGLALVEASHGKIGSPVQEVVLLLCHFDPVTGRYGIAVMRVLQVLGVLTVLLLGAGLGILSLRGRSRRDEGKAVVSARAVARSQPLPEPEPAPGGTGIGAEPG